MVWTPNLIIAGVAKCGTTSIHDVLAEHPRVIGGIEKEPWFLNDTHDNLCPSVNVHTHGLEAWARQFHDEGQGNFDIWMDASATYQYQQTAKEVIADLDPQPKVMFVVRDPARRLFSLYQYARYHHRAIPHIHSFSQFIESVREPVDSRLLDQNLMVHAWSTSRYDLMLEEWSQIVPRERLFVTSIEEFSADRNRVLTRLSQWLGIDPEGFKDATVNRSNPTVVTRSKFVRQLGKKLAHALPDTRAIRSLKTAVRELNSAPVDKSEFEENAELIAQLSVEFAPHMERFQEMRTSLAW
ncbi:MAG: sulfotransferase [Hoeflea sp.]